MEPLLRRITQEQIVLVSTGTSDWLGSSHTAEKVEGGYHVTGSKILGSGSSAGTLLITSAVYDEPADGLTVLIRKTVAANACIQTVEKAFEVVSGGAFLRSFGLERLLSDVHGGQFHPLQEKRQHLFTSRVALGLDPVV